MAFKQDRVSLDHRDYQKVTVTHHLCDFETASPTPEGGDCSGLYRYQRGIAAAGLAAKRSKYGHVVILGHQFVNRGFQLAADPGMTSRIQILYESRDFSIRN
jgi:hypothetical protein